MLLVFLEGEGLILNKSDYIKLSSPRVINFSFLITFNAFMLILNKAENKHCEYP